MLRPAVGQLLELQGALGRVYDSGATTEKDHTLTRRELRGERWHDILRDRERLSEQVRHPEQVAEDRPGVGAIHAALFGQRRDRDGDAGEYLRDEGLRGGDPDLLTGAAFDDRVCAPREARVRVVRDREHRAARKVVAVEGVQHVGGLAGLAHCDHESAGAEHRVGGFAGDHGLRGHEPESAEGRRDDSPRVERRSAANNGDALKCGELKSAPQRTTAGCPDQSVQDATGELGLLVDLLRHVVRVAVQAHI